MAQSAASENRQKTGKGPVPRTAFKPGQSGNPGGRPKKDERIRRLEELCKEHSPEAVAALLDEAKNGKGAPRVAAAVAILDRGWGRPVERQESGEPGAFDGLTDVEVEAEAKAALAEGVKSGLIKVLAPKAK